MYPSPITVVETDIQDLVCHYARVLGTCMTLTHIYTYAQNSLIQHRDSAHTHKHMHICTPICNMYIP